MNIKERQKVVLAALLHDIGKFWERGESHFEDSDNIKKSFPNKEYKHTVPTYENGSPKYRHALWTQAFFDTFNPGEYLDLESTKDLNLATLSARHHKPSNHLEGIISLADKWSSAIDRPDEGEEAVSGYEKIKDKWGDKFNKKVRLGSIFDAIERKTIEKFYSYKLQKLDIDNEHVIFPTETVIDKNKTIVNEYHDLWEEFTKNFEEVKKRCKDFDSFILSLLDVLRIFTWCIPSATNLEPACVSLNEHLRTTAGIALCLYDFMQDKNIQIEFSGSAMIKDLEKKDSLLMVCIDISGIQKFIYDITNKRAAKSLKGRSFFLQLLMDNVIKDILDHKDIKAYPTNVIYASGGKAYLILPNIERVKDAITEISNLYQTLLWNDYQGKLFIAFGKVEFGYDTFKDANTQFWSSKVFSSNLTDLEVEKLGKDINSLDLGDIWRIVSDRASANKFIKFKNKVLEFENLFRPIPYKINSVKCAATGVSKPKSDMVLFEKGEGEESDIYVLKTVNDQIKLGEKLKRGNFLVSYKKAENIEHHIDINGTKYEIKALEAVKKLPSNRYESANIFSFNNTSISDRPDNTGFSTIFYGGNEQPMKNDGDAKTFEELCALTEEKRTKLGILRMDVDNLGNIFINGFGDDKNGYIIKKSFAAYSTLSFLLEVFFCGYLNTIREKDKYCDLVQILYSGGDDLFAIGRWDAIIDFAEEVRNEFIRFTCRDDITISGGVAIVDAKYPISKAAQLAGDAEKKAKTYNDMKNAFNFFDQTVKWGEEFDFVKSMKDGFLFFDGIVSRALIQNIQKYKLLKDKGKKDKKNDFSYVWNSAYTITRTLDRIGKDKHPEAWSFVDTIRKNIIHNDKFGAERYLDLLAIGARWAEYLLKLK